MGLRVTVGVLFKVLLIFVSTKKPWPDNVVSPKIRWTRNSKDALRSGTPLAGGYKGCLWSIIGDLDYLVSVLGLPNFNSARPCSLCRCSLAGANSWSNFTPAAAWRTQCWTHRAWKRWDSRSKCPLFDLNFVSALSVHLDYMHCKYLGVDQYTYGSVLALLCCKVMGGSPLQNLQAVWADIKVFYREWNKGAIQVPQQTYDVSATEWDSEVAREGW